MEISGKIVYHNPYIINYIGKDKETLKQWAKEHEKLLLNSVSNPNIHSTIEMKLNAIRVAIVS